MIELDELSTFAWSLDTLPPLKHPLDPHLYPKSVGYTAKVSIAIQAVLKLSFAWPAGSRSGKSAPMETFSVSTNAFGINGGGPMGALGEGEYQVTMQKCLTRRVLSRCPITFEQNRSKKHELN